MSKARKRSPHRTHTVHFYRRDGTHLLPGDLVACGTKQTEELVMATFRPPVTCEDCKKSKDYRLADSPTIYTLRLSPRCYNALRREGYDYVDEVRDLSDDQLLAIRGINDIALEEIRTKLQTAS